MMKVETDILYRTFCSRNMCQATVNFVMEMFELNCMETVLQVINIEDIGFGIVLAYKSSHFTSANASLEVLNCFLRTFLSGFSYNTCTLVLSPEFP